MTIRRKFVSEALGAAVSTMRAIIGVPNYERYLEHMRRRHPSETPLRFEEFEQQRLADKYLRPGAKCC